VFMLLFQDFLFLTSKVPCSNVTVDEQRVLILCVHTHCGNHLANCRNGFVCLFISAGTSPTAAEPERPSKLKAFEDLDALGKSLLQQSLPSSCKLGSQFAMYVYCHL